MSLKFWATKTHQIFKYLRKSFARWCSILLSLELNNSIEFPWARSNLYLKVCKVNLSEIWNDNSLLTSIVDICTRLYRLQGGFSVWYIESSQKKDKIRLPHPISFMDIRDSQYQLSQFYQAAHLGPYRIFGIWRFVYSSRFDILKA